MLPTMNSEEPGGISGAGNEKVKRQGMAKVIVDTIRDAIGDLGKVAGWWRPRERGF